MILKSNERATRVPFEITSMISDQNCTPLSSIATLIITSIMILKSHNLMAEIQELQDFSQYQNLSNITCKICQTMAFFVFHFPAM